MTKKTVSWAELLRREPQGIIDVFAYVADQNPVGMQVLMRLQREGHPNLLLGVEAEDYDPEDAEAIGRGGVALIATEYARMLREGDPAATDNPDVAPVIGPNETLDERLESLRHVGAYVAAEIDQLIAMKAGLA